MGDIYHAIRTGNRERVRDLLQSGNAKEDYRPFLWYLIHMRGKSDSRDMEIARLLMQAKARPDIMTDIFISSLDIEATTPEMLKLLVSDCSYNPPIHVNIRDSVNQMPLHRHATWSLHEEHCRILIEAKADINATTANGYTPIMHAVLLGEVENARVLLNAGADLTLKAKDGTSVMTPTPQWHIPRAPAQMMIRNTLFEVIDKALMIFSAEIVKEFLTWLM